MISLRESTINNQQFSIGFDRIFTLQSSYRHGSVDDMSIRTDHSECIKNMVYHFFIITKLEIISLFLNMGFLICHKISLKCSHFTLVKERTVWTTPQIQEIVN